MRLFFVLTCIDTYFVYIWDCMSKRLQQDCNRLCNGQLLAHIYLLQTSTMF